MMAMWVDAEDQFRRSSGIGSHGNRTDKELPLQVRFCLHPAVSGLRIEGLLCLEYMLSTQYCHSIPLPLPLPLPLPQ